MQLSESTFKVPQREADIEITRGERKSLEIWMEEKLFRIDGEEVCRNHIFIGGIFNTQKHMFDEAINYFLETEKPNFVPVKNAIADYIAESELLGLNDNITESRD